jgi:hypothetical protein
MGCGNQSQAFLAKKNWDFAQQQRWTSAGLKGLKQQQHWLSDV